MPAVWKDREGALAPPLQRGQALLSWDVRRMRGKQNARCLHGYGLCLWRQSRFDEAVATFTRMFWLNPSDNQGARFNLKEVNAGRAWEAES